MDKNKLVLPVSILVGCIVLGGFYYASEANKQASIEKQQQVELQAKEDAEKAQYNKEQADIFQKSFCATQAEKQAQDQYKLTCTYDCHTGYFYIAEKDSYYNTCLQENGLK